MDINELAKKIAEEMRHEHICNVGLTTETVHNLNEIANAWKQWKKLSIIILFGIIAIFFGFAEYIKRLT
jgi:hypothetical protein